MPDYTGLNEQEKINELISRDNEMIEMDEEIDGQLSTINTQNAQIAALTAATIPTPDNVIGGINAMTDVHLSELSNRIRTTEAGIRAYTSFVFGKVSID